MIASKTDFHTPPALSPLVADHETSAVATSAGCRWLAVLRLATGIIFVWTFIDQTLGNSAAAGPLTPLWLAIVSPLCAVMFLAPMLAVGIIVIIGLGLRVSAVVGAGTMLAMYLAESSFSTSTSTSTASHSPLVEHHVIYALALIVVAAFDAGDTWGLGRWWKARRVVQRHRWLI